MIDFSKELTELVHTYWKIFYMMGTIFILAGFIYRLYQENVSPKLIMHTIALTIIVFGAMSLYPQIFKEYLNVMYSVHFTAEDEVYKFMESIKDPKLAESGWYDIIIQNITIAIYKICWGVGHITKLLMIWFQIKISQVMVIISPLVLSFIMFPPFQSSAIRFCQLSIAMGVWVLSLNIADIMVMEILTELLNNMSVTAAGVAGGAGGLAGIASFITSGTITGPILLQIIVIITLCMIAVYIFVPLLVVTLIQGGALNSAITATATSLQNVSGNIKSGVGGAGKLMNSAGGFMHGKLKGFFNKGGSSKNITSSGQATSGNSGSSADMGKWDNQSNSKPSPGKWD